jgi:hypothetical protein
MIFMLLNLVRDHDYDSIPSYSYAKNQESKDADLSYYEIKELK